MTRRQRRINSWKETWPGDPARGVPEQQVRVRLHAPPDPPPHWAAGEDTLWLSLPEDLTLARYAKRVPVTLRWKVEAIRPRRGRLGRCAAELGLAYLRLRQARDALPWYPDSPDKIYDHLWWALDSAERGWRRARLARWASGGTRGAERRPRPQRADRA